MIMPETIEPVVLRKKFMDAGYGFIHGFNHGGKLIDFTIADPNEKTNNARCTTYLGDKDIHDIDLLGGLKLPVVGNAEVVLDSEYGSWKVPDPNYKPEDHIKVKVFPGFAYRHTKEEALAM